MKYPIVSGACQMDKLCDRLSLCSKATDGLISQLFTRFRVVIFAGICQ